VFKTPVGCLFYNILYLFLANVVGMITVHELGNIFQYIWKYHNPWGNPIVFAMGISIFAVFGMIKFGHWDRNPVATRAEVTDMANAAF
jgi:hypothetical protein